VRRSRRTLLSAALIVLGLGVIAFNGVRAIADRRLSDAFAGAALANRSSTSTNIWPWVVGAAALAGGIAIADARTGRR